MAGSLSGVGTGPKGPDGADEVGGAGATGSAGGTGTGAVEAEGAIVRGSAPTPAGGTAALSSSFLEQSLSAWKVDKTAVSRVTSDALPQPGLVPAERKLHADVEKVLYSARGDVAMGTLLSRETFEAHVARNRPQIEALQAKASDLAEQYGAESDRCTDPARRAGLELREDYYRGLSRSIGARFDEIVDTNRKQCDLRYGAPKPPAAPPVALPKLDKPEADGKVKKAWNDAATDALNELRKQDIRKLGNEGLASALKGAFPKDSEVPEADRAKYNEAVGLLSKQIAAGVIGLPVTENLAHHLSGFVDDATRFLHAQLTFSRAKSELKEEVAQKGGLYPGEEKAADAAVAPLAAEVEAAKAQLDKRQNELKTKFSHTVGADLDLNSKILFVKNVKGKVAVDWEAKDFKAKIYADVRIDAPLTADAKLTVEGGAEVQAGKFSAAVHGKATVDKLWTDPVFGPTAEVDFRLAYDDPKLKASLSGKALVPLGPGGGDQRRLDLNAALEAPYRGGNLSAGAYFNAALPVGGKESYGAGASVGYTKGNMSLNAGLGTTWGPGVARPGVTATVGVKITF